MYKAVIFDFFDVIHRDHQKAWLAAHGYKRTGGFAEASDLLDKGQINVEEYLERFAKQSGMTADEVAAEFQAFAKLDKEVVELIEALHRKYQTGLISNTHTNEIRPILDMHDLHRLFHEICISSEIGIAKPDPEIFRYMAKKLGVEPNECIFVDDNPDNVAASEAVRMKGIVFTGRDDLAAALDKLGIKA